MIDDDDIGRETDDKATRVILDRQMNDVIDDDSRTMMMAMTMWSVNDDDGDDDDDDQ